MFHILHVPTGELVHTYRVTNWGDLDTYYVIEPTGTLVSYKYKLPAIAMLKIIANRCKIDPAEFELIHV